VYEHLNTAADMARWCAAGADSIT